ncbi:MAG: hypothetical protein KatS3mg103_0526 [Phycisphaerales bacterium]|nr:MAG: hypothetical protein KatS3mg103_0526 [Phycisphaerales bacterium]
MDMIVHPALLLVALAIGGVGVALAIPRRRLHASLVGGVVAALGVGLLIVGLGGATLARGEAAPPVAFHVLAIIALGSCLQVITHRRPVYAALYFILSILSTAGLYLLLSAEFMAFALVIIYAGAILITYLFVIMLASQSQAEDVETGMAEYDAVGRGPITATIAGFALLATLTVMLFGGAAALPAPDVQAAERNELAVLERLPGKVEKALRRTGELSPGEAVVGLSPEGQAVHALVRGQGGGTRSVPLPETLAPTNTEVLAFNLLGDYPGTIEIAGVILLMAMVGAVVLARKFAQIDEEAKAAAAAALAARRAQSQGDTGPAASDGGRVGP